MTIVASIISSDLSSVTVEVVAHAAVAVNAIAFVVLVVFRRVFGGVFGLARSDDRFR